MRENELYEPPALLEVGDFAELTRGTPAGNMVEGGPDPSHWWYYNPAG
ncbi:lasso RiPP family leader peptide-containing protein [Streptomyces luteireticuli]|uniref:Lasso RiPP family leader peptide-containing protein n=1 Tax=Streptomyces luteireticuli TaxID=173858 RepID=A0ABN0YWU8_9ACTN